MKQTRGNIPVVHICNEVSTEDLGEPWRWFISSEVLTLKIGSAVSIQGPECALSNLVLLSHCFYSVLGFLQPGWARGELWAVQGSTCCLHPWRDFSGCRRQEGSKAASSKIKLCDTPEYLTAWKALLCLELPFIFLSEHLTVKALSCLKTLI